MINCGVDDVQKEVEEEKQARVGQVSDLVGWIKGLQGRTGGPTAESSLAAQQVPKIWQVNGSVACVCVWTLHTEWLIFFVGFPQAISEQLAGKKDEVAEAIRSTEVFLRSKQASK